MIGLLLNLILMGFTLGGLLKVYYLFPFFNENPKLSGIGGVMLLLIILWIFPKIIGLVIKFVFFSAIVFFICQTMGWKLDFLKTPKDTVENLGNKATEITDAIDKLKMLATPNETFSAKATQVPSGRSVQFGDENVVLFGIDSPDIAQNCKNKYGDDYSCGQIAKDKLQALTFGQELSCESKGTNSKGQKVASCTNANGDDIAALMVRSGWAIADKSQTEKYVEEEISAYKQKVGMWEGKFKEPKKWRQHSKDTENSSDNKNKQTPFEKLKSFLKK